MMKQLLFGKVPVAHQLCSHLCCEVAGQQQRLDKKRVYLKRFSLSGNFQVIGRPELEKKNVIYKSEVRGCKAHRAIAQTSFMLPTAFVASKLPVRLIVG